MRGSEERLASVAAYYAANPGMSRKRLRHWIVSNLTDKDWVLNSRLALEYMDALEIKDLAPTFKRKVPKGYTRIE